MARPEIIKTPLGKRLRDLRGERDRDDWAAELDLSKSTIAHYERGDRVPDATFLEKLAALGVDLNALILGESHSHGGPQNDDFAYVPRLTIRASAGAGAIAVTEEADSMLAFRSEWLRRRGINPAAASVLTATGDSNEPTIRDGDILLVDTSIRQIRDNGFYIVVISELVFVKRVHLSMDGSVTLLSDNDVYPPERVAKADVQDLYLAGRVMWFGRAL